MRNSTLRQLELFYAIARLGSFTRAAEESYVTQPTISMQIKKLTDSVGVPLFEHVGKKVYLTDAGCELRKTCNRIFTELERFEMYVADLKGLETGALRIAVVTTAKYFIPRLLGAFCQRHPGIEVSLKVSNRERILSRISDNEDDLYVLGQPPEGIDVVAEPFLPNPLVVLAPWGHPLAKEKDITLQRLAEEPFLLREPGSGTRNAAERLFVAHGLKPKVRMELGSNEAIKQAVIGGLGVSVLSKHTLVMDGSGRQISVLDVEGFPIERQWYVVYPEEKRLSVVARAFMEHLRAVQDRDNHLLLPTANEKGSAPFLPMVE
ncbi:MAG: LysR family transcriptional regulator [Pseudomonadota bacterium]|nr:LysR family transcriptional regulator [Pseudomonadota bacterium]